MTLTNARRLSRGVLPWHLRPAYQGFCGRATATDRGELLPELLPPSTGPEELAEGRDVSGCLHDTAEGWEPLAGAVWGLISGQDGVDVPALFERPELVGHQDHCPGNVVFRSGLPAALIDFDLARPTSRVADCVNAMYWWVLSRATRISP